MTIFAQDQSSTFSTWRPTGAGALRAVHKTHFDVFVIGDVNLRGLQRIGAIQRAVGRYSPLTMTHGGLRAFSSSSSDAWGTHDTRGP